MRLRIESFRVHPNGGRKNNIFGNQENDTFFILAAPLRRPRAPRRAGESLPGRPPVLVAEAREVRILRRVPIDPEPGSIGINRVR